MSIKQVISGLTLPVTEYDDEWLELGDDELWKAIQTTKVQLIASIGENQDVKIYKPYFDNDSYNHLDIYVFVYTKQWGFKHMMTLKEYVNGNLTNKMQGKRMLNLIHMENIFTNISMQEGKKLASLPGHIDLITYIDDSFASWLAQMMEILHLSDQHISSSPEEVRSEFQKWLEAQTANNV